MILKRFYEEKIAQASYLVGCAVTGEAIVIDPNRHIDQYVEAASAENLRITAVTETHIHADFASGARALADRMGAKLYLSGEGGPDWQYLFGNESLHNGDSIRIGNVRLDALHTPGHTPEHLSFVLTDEAASPTPLAVFTGDFLFVGDVGRPDLLERAAGFSGTMETGARQLFNSISQFSALPDHVLIFPGHGAGSACGKKLGGVPVSSLGYEKLSNWAFLIGEEEGFVAKVLNGQPDPPNYFAEMKRVNRHGIAPWDGAVTPRLHPAQLDLAEIVVDIRSAAEFAAGFTPKSLSIPLNRSFVTWAGTILPYGQPLYLVAESEAQVRIAVRDLALIGLDAVGGWFGPEAVERSRRSGTIAQIQKVQPAQINEGSLLIDVRGGDEYAAGHIPGALHFPLGRLQQGVSSLPRDTPVVVHCQGGVRSPIAVSMMARMGFTNVSDLAGGYAAYRAAIANTRSVAKEA